MSSSNASYNGRRSSSNRRIVETTPIEGEASIITSRNGGGGSGSSNTEALKLYEAIIFSGPIVFILIILFLFYFFYLRRHSVDWSSLRMRASNSAAVAAAASDGVEVAELGLKKEFREMLPIIVFKESFSVRDTQCAVCLGDYQAEDRLQQIPGCCHTFHLNCIDLWLATHTTCPLCRLSLISSSKTPPASEPDSNNQIESRFEDPESVDDILRLNRLQVL